MNKVLLGLLLVSLSMQTGLEAHIGAVMSKFEQMPLKGEFSREIAGLVELTLMQSSQIEEVLKEIKAIRDELQQDQVVEDNEYAHKLGYLNVEIEVLEYQVEKLSNELKTANTFIGEVSSEIATLIGTQTSLDKQLTMLGSKEEDIRNGFTEFQEDFKKRGVNNEKVIEALNEIISKLSNAVFDSQDRTAVLSEVHTKQVVDILKRELGASNPIAAFVSVTTRFDVPTVTRVIQLLEHIRDSTFKQQVDGEQQMIAAQQAYDQTLSEVIDVRERLGADLYRTRQVLKRRGEEKALAEKTLKQIQKDLPIAQDLLINTRIQRETLVANYNQRKLKRENELKIISQAYTIVAAQVR